MSATLREIIDDLDASLKSGTDYERVRTNALHMLDEKLHAGDAELHCRLLLVVSESLLRCGSATEALPYSKEALAVARQASSKKLEATTLGIIGTIHWFLSDYSEALQHHQAALRLNKEINSDSGSAANLGNIATVYWHISDYTRALEYMQEAIRLHEQTDNKRSLAANLGNIGGIYAELSNPTVALEYMLRALNLMEEIGSTDGVAIWTGNVGTVYSSLGDHQRALEWYQKALSLHEALENKSGIETNLVNIGAEYVEVGDYSRAIEYYKKSYALNTEMSNRRGAAMDLCNIGVVYSSTKYEGYDPILAEEYLLKALDQLQQLGAKKEQYETHHAIAQLYEQQEQWKKQSFHFKQYHNIEKEVQSEAAINQAEQLEHRRKVEEAERDRQVKLARFQEQEKILHNILPAQIAERILEGEKRIADTFENVSIFFSDIVGFTKLSQEVTAHELVSLLDDLFREFDRIARRHGLEKIKTIGDAYMAVSGAPIHAYDHALRAARFAIDVVEMTANFKTQRGVEVQLRVGLHCGTVVAGVIGDNKFAYDLWGDTVNTASRMESYSEAGQIHCSSDFINEIQRHSHQMNEEFCFTERGEIEIKGKGKMTTFFLARRV